MMELLLITAVLILPMAILPVIAAGLGLVGTLAASQAARRQARAMERATEPTKKEQAFMEGLRRGFLGEREELLRRFGSLPEMAEKYLFTMENERDFLSREFERLAQSPAFYAGRRLAAAEQAGRLTDSLRRGLQAMVASGMRGNALLRMMAGAEVQKQMNLERMMAEQNREDMLQRLQALQQASQLRESIAAERLRIPMMMEEQLAARSLGTSSNIGALAQANTQAQMAAQQYLAQQKAAQMQQLMQGIAGLFQAIQQQEAMKRYGNIMTAPTQLPPAYGTFGGYGGF